MRKRKKTQFDAEYEKALNSKNIEWIDIGVKGLSDFIPGLPKGDAILVRGEPGTGKTILCLQFMYKGIQNGETVVYITTEETPETIMRTGAELWPDFPKLIEEEKFIIINLSINAKKLLLETKKRGATTILTAEGIPKRPDIPEYLVDHLIYLDYQKHDVIWTRVFVLRKSRSVPLKPRILKLNIESQGLWVEEIPISLKPVWFASKL
jgi:KaiC/GvpD/RAD55 family RecA-like ATPase